MSKIPAYTEKVPIKAKDPKIMKPPIVEIAA